MNMEPGLNVISVILLLTVGQGLFLSYLLYFSKGSFRQANLFLSLLVLVFSYMLFDAFMKVSMYYFEFPHLIGIHCANNYLYGPLLYFYVRNMTQRPAAFFSLRDFWHFLPFVISIIRYMPYYFSEEQQKIDEWVNNMASLTDAGYEWSISWSKIMHLIHITGYLLFNISLTSKHRVNIKNEYSNIEKRNLCWLQNVLWLLSALLIVALIRHTVPPSQVNLLLFDNILNLSIAIVIYFLGFMAIHQPQIFTAPNRGTRDESHSKNNNFESDVGPELFKPDLVRPKVKYQNTNVTDALAEDINRQLLVQMKSAKLYQQNDLSLTSLAEILEVSPHALSQVINESLNCNFYDFVNSYRIKEALRLLELPDKKLSILDIAMEVGFNSKSSFYTAFKKNVGLTPSQYRKQKSPKVLATEQ
ncbi:helix-turn-helix domain-containing protein [Aliikangiella coralliicola]|uniref:AraC family transcriptional regulator n=1 Tax=Aliikangiella coralliicola TaxID=2592383 RepID=A0A545U6P0_9GAMM|nr:helix-turn-helix domain-containing protein [Aliikangiella coralliicola]TQV85073.1 AraC family transcriptional regulator [Aliikangiella coralliicola]